MSIIFCLIGVFHSLAQTNSLEENDVTVIFLNDGTNNFIRVMPSDPFTQDIILNNGFRVERFETVNGIISKPDFTKSDFTWEIKHWDKEKINSTFQSEDKETLIDLIYLDDTQLEDLSGKENFTSYKTFQQVRNMGLNLIACESKLKAQALGLLFVDKSSVKGQEYMYRVSFKNTDGQPLVKYIQGSSKRTKTPTVQITNKIESLNKVVLYWNIKQTVDHYFAFYIEKSKDGENYTRINKEPFLPLFSNNKKLKTDLISFSDSTENYVPYFYRVTGLSYFGEMGTPSDPILASAIDDQAPRAPQIIGVEELSDRNVNLLWNWEGSATDIDSFIIYSNETKPWSQVGAKSKEESYSYEDIVTSPERKYVVCAVDTARNRACSYEYNFLAIDTFPPSIPDNFQGVIDSNGVVTLNWSNSPDQDLWGYFIYMHGTDKEAMIKVTPYPIETNTFVDTLSLNTLDKEIYYSIAAIDLTSNISNQSARIRLKRPDKVPPTPAVFKDYHKSKDSIFLSWYPSSFLDVSSQVLERKTNISDWIIVRELQPLVNQYNDSGLESKTIYTYRIITTDDSGNSAISPKNLSIKTNSFEDNIPSINLSLEKNNESIILKWNGYASSNLTNILIYKNQNDNGLRLYKKLDSSSVSYKDSISNKELSYAIRYEYTSGKKSRFSNLVKI